MSYRTHMKRSRIILVAFLILGTCLAAAPPVFRNRIGQFTLLQPLRMLPSVRLAGADGTTADFGPFASTALLLNFWATWCAPCVAELPSLDQLAAQDFGGRLSVAAISIDRQGDKLVAPFLVEHHISSLPVYLDPAQKLGSIDAKRKDGALPLYGLPITYFVDKQGIVLGYIAGQMDWQSPEARAFLDYLVTR